MAVLTENVKRNGMNSIDPDRLKRSVALVSRVFEVPEPKVDEIWSERYLPARADLMVRP